MSEPGVNPLQQVVTWMSAHAGFPQRRLVPKAETMLCMAALAAAEDAANAERFLVQRRNAAMDSAQRAHALRRSRVHFKCDNSAKV